MAFIPKDFLKQDVRIQLRKAFNLYGIEGTEEKVKSVYSKTPKIRDLFLKEYYLLLKGE